MLSISISISLSVKREDVELIQHFPKQVEFAFRFCTFCKKTLEKLHEEKDNNNNNNTTTKGGALLKTCAACQLVAYCDTNCQQKDWKWRHKTVCKAVKARIMEMNKRTGKFIDDLD